jgi:hypothetical protein
MNINIEKIKNECPNAYYKFLNDCDYQEYNYYDELRIAYNHYYDDDGEHIDICYCDYEKFFNSFKIRLTIIYYMKGKWLWRVYDDRDFFIEDDKLYELDEAKEAAIYKAFQILEAMLKENVK